MDVEEGTKPFFVFDMANNHSGSAKHGLAIIKEVNKAVKSFRDRFDFGFKLQYRDLDTFIHPDFRGRDDIKYVKRFSETRLGWDELLQLKNEMESLKFKTICTPFDENSVDMIEEHGFDIIKIASCSFTDWPLLERVVKTEKPIIASTAGATLEDIDRVVSFFTHRDKCFSLMHCVAEYPTANEYLQLNQIDLLKARYPGVKIGYSTHESPDNIDSVKIAVGKGASIFEKHVGVVSGSVKLNGYSATPEQVGKWLASAEEAFDMCGVTGKRADFTEKEVSSLMSLRRGVFAKTKFSSGDRINLSDTFLAIPTTKDQVTANDMSKYSIYFASNDIGKGQPLLFSEINRVEIREKVYEIMKRVKTLIHESRIAVPNQLEFEVSHHYGIDRFDEYGATIITYVNREYCKKLIVMLGGQKHPEQYHKVKEETFILLYGDLEIILDGEVKNCKPGDIITVERGVKHIFSSKKGAILEEVSSTHHKGDSYYTDPAIGRNTSRKTHLTYWVD
ncbi:MAG: N-acetylneuraminate synthase family protein [Candidatus Altiarchaeota archaeon]|nr:N-acetylneuraminate synthase family protein [Candidatus Altiarchaeota archaeon]